MKKPLTLLLATTLLMISSMSFGATYYVNASNGNDSNSGLSPETPWKTIAKVNASKFQPGDNILFRRGEIWREQLNVPSSGTQKMPITFGDYGTGAKPIISGADVFNIDNWNQDTTNTGVWYMDNHIFQKGIIVVIDNMRFLPAAAKNEPGACHFYYDDTIKRIYVYLKNDPDKHLSEVSVREDCIRIHSKQHITIRNIRCQYARYSGIRLMGIQSTGFCTIQNCETYHNRIFGVVCQNGHDQNNIENCISSYNGINLYTMNADSNKFRNNISFNAIKYSISPKTDGTGFGNQESDNTVFEGNEVFRNESTGIEAWHGSNLTFNRNFSYDNSGNGFSADYLTGNNRIIYNIFKNNNNSHSSNYGILIWKNNIGNFNIYNNTIYNDSENEHGIYLGHGNIILMNNIVYIAQKLKYCLVIDPNAVLQSDHNNLFSTTGKIVLFDFKDCTLKEWQAILDQDINSIAENPLFVDPKNNDFRILSNSPCIDRGVNLKLSYDFNGKLISSNLNIPDIGAIEYNISILSPKSLRIIN